ncbi:MAG: hypothetical protein HZT41_16260 [Dechloromonas sp.]|jgi:hypothetical protein|nr:MAG: hypothetical protein HZT41_16260 [Dechloromonas sp.]
MPEEHKQPDVMAEYRKWLVAAEQKSQEDFDKTVLALSGGALGISFAFLKDILGPQPIVLSGFLLAAWFAWAFSTFSVLISYYLSHLALRRAIGQVDDGTIFKRPPGGVFACLTAILNGTGAVLFLVGVCCITVFAVANLPTKGATIDRKETAITTAPSSTTTAKAPVTAVNTDAGQSPAAD